MKSITFSGISKNETTQLKAYAILIIMLHNLYRWIKPQPWDNEFDFNPATVSNFIHLSIQKPLEIWHLLLSFVGHYGVQVFLILSAYGLMKSYQNKSIKWWDFIKIRYIKLYPSYVIAFLTFAFYILIFEGRLIEWYVIKNCLWQLSTIGNFIPKKALIIIGPWWFYSLIFQVYAIIPLIFVLYKKYGQKALLYIGIIGYIITISSYSFVKNYDLNILHTALGHLPEIVFGIWLASKNSLKIKWWIFPIVFIVFIASNFYYNIWFFSHLSAGILMFFILLWLIRITANSSIITKISLFIGSISMYLFAIQGFVRWTFIGKANAHANTLASFLFGILYVIFAIAIAYLLTKIEAEYRNYVSKGTTQIKKYFRIALPILLIIIFFAIFKFENKRSQILNEKQKIERKN